MTVCNNSRYQLVSMEDEEKAAYWEARARLLAGQAQLAIEGDLLERADHLLRRARLCEHAASQFRQGKTTAGIRRVENRPPPWWQR